MKGKHINHHNQYTNLPVQYIKCIGCGKLFPFGKTKKKTRKYCNGECYHKNRPIWNKGLTCVTDSRILVGKRNGMWKENKIRKRQINRSLKLKVLKADNNMCQVCFIEGKIVRDNLELHHMISFEIIPKNKFKNLITVCGDCHQYIHKNELTLSP